MTHSSGLPPAPVSPFLAYTGLPLPSVQNLESTVTLWFEREPSRPEKPCLVWNVTV